MTSLFLAAASPDCQLQLRSSRWAAKSAFVGGGTSNSYGLIWVGANHIAQAEGYSDSRAETMTNMNFLAGGEAMGANLESFIDQSPVACSSKHVAFPSVS